MHVGTITVTVALTIRVFSFHRKSNIADSYHHGAGKESSYETLIENPYYREHTGNQPDDNVIITSLRKIPE